MTGAERSFAALAARIERLRDAGLHEARIDLLEEAPRGLIARLPRRDRLVVTVRPAREGGGWRGDEGTRVALLREALDAGVGHVDLEASTPEETLRGLLGAPGPSRRILSVHLARGSGETPLAALARLGARPAHVLKLAVPVDDAADLAALREAGAASRRETVLVGMGEAGVLSRLAFRAFGSAWTYVAADAEGRTADGQWTFAAARRIGLDRQPPLVLGLLGGPEAPRSPGPRVYNTLLPRSGRPFAYVALPTSRPAAVLSLLRAGVLAGLSVTMPHKETVRDLIDAEAPSARHAGSVNTIAADSGRLAGHSTDGQGAVAALGGPSALRGRRLTILGAGGAARALAQAAVDAGAAVTVAARNPARAAALAAASGAAVRPWAEATAEPFDVLVNATPIGSDGASCPVADRAALAGRVVLDMVVEPRRTPLLRAAEEAGAAAIPGIVMWAHQGAAQMRILAGMTLDPAELLRQADEGGTETHR